MNKNVMYFLIFSVLFFPGCSQKLDYHYSYYDSALFSSAGWSVQTHSSCGLVILEEGDVVKETRIITGKGKPSAASLDYSVNARIEVCPEEGKPEKAALYYIINGKLVDFSSAGPFGVFLVTRYGDVIRLDKYHFSGKENEILKETYAFWQKKVSGLNEENKPFITENSLILNILGEIYGSDIIKDIEEYLI